MTAYVSDFPVQDVILDALEHAFGGSFTINDEGEHVIVGADYSLHKLLQFLSGIDPEDGHWEIEPEEGTADHPFRRMGVWEQHQSEYHINNVCRALIQEIRRLRALVPEEVREP